MFGELIRAFLLIFAAEMGDKTQIIAMTFATQYKVKEVIFGVILGVIFNHGIAILLGRFISTVVPMNLIQIVAGIMFVVFGVMALKDEDIDETNDKKSFSPIITVAIAFFVGELGDKTQLTAMTLSIEASYPIFILVGTTLGMVATSGFGIFIGSKIGEKIPEIAIKVASSIVFIFFGSLKLFNTIPKDYINITNIILYLLIIAIIEIILMKKLINNRRGKEKSPMIDVASKLYNQTKVINETIESICLGEGKCGKCIGSNCLIGYTRFIIKEARKNGNYYSDAYINLDFLIKKEYDNNKVLEALSIIMVDSVNNSWNTDENFVINKVRNSLEVIIFGQIIGHKSDINTYFKEAKLLNKEYGTLLEKKVYTKLHN
ncbi:TMEM165/GDT1 family protein [Tissierella pigra]|uniref:GDT1 family protein n=1 Tax=Tissierella pigra TaxID=2607614 RepID=A0A6N7Y065_9FIRM|nr:TMEM165/GDT1 family protein [Tissierella pigra]MBU5426400.1 TMEM165/GDT1 family protein [Tissierella pigra]MSU03133.1 TMEM165/GDT1 family protein [Tissierella pigra]